MAVSAVVASSTRRSLVMMVGIPEKSATSSGDQRIRLGRIVAGFKGGLVFISTTETLNASSFIAHSDDRLKPNFTLSPAAYPACPDSDRARSPANPRSRHRREMAYAALAVRAPAIHPACCPAVRRAAAARRDPVAAAATHAFDFPTGFSAARSTPVPAASADPPSGPI